MKAIERIRAAAKTGALCYSVPFFGKQYIPVDALEEKYDLIKSAESGDEGGHVYYFQNQSAPNLMMRLSINRLGVISLRLENISYFQTELGETV